MPAMRLFTGGGAACLIFSGLKVHAVHALPGRVGVAMEWVRLDMRRQAFLETACRSRARRAAEQTVRQTGAVGGEAEHRGRPSQRAPRQGVRPSQLIPRVRRAEAG